MNEKMPVQLSPLDYPSNTDRVMRMMIAILVNGGMSVEKAIDRVVGKSKS